MSRIAERVVLVHRRDQLRATKIYHEPLIQAENVEFRWNSTVTELLHEEKLTGIRLRDVQTGAESVLPCDGLFISVGRKAGHGAGERPAGAGCRRLCDGGTKPQGTKSPRPVYAVGRCTDEAAAPGSDGRGRWGHGGPHGGRISGRRRLIEEMRQRTAEVLPHICPSRSNAGIRDAGGLKRTQLPGVSDGTDSSGQFLYPCFAERQATEKEPVMRQTARSGGALWAGSSVLFQQPSDF